MVELANLIHHLNERVSIPYLNAYLISFGVSKHVGLRLLQVFLT